MAYNKGKAFEDKFKGDFQKVPNATIDRLYDVTNGYKNIKQCSDFIGFIATKQVDEVVYGNIYYLECKSCKGASIPFSNISQYDNLLKKMNRPGVRAGVILWLYEKDKVWYIPVKTIKQMKADGEKSIGLRHIGSKYRFIEIPSVKKRVFMDSDYSVLTELQEGD